MSSTVVKTMKLQRGFGWGWQGRTVYLCAGGVADQLDIPPEVDTIYAVFTTRRRAESFAVGDAGFGYLEVLDDAGNFLTEVYVGERSKLLKAAKFVHIEYDQ